LLYNKLIKSNKLKIKEIHFKSHFILFKTTPPIKEILLDMNVIVLTNIKNKDKKGIQNIS